MNLDNLLMIPHLSKELNLIGQPSLPYILQKPCKNKSGKTDDQAAKIVFETQKMLETLISVCLELVKQNKAQGFNEESVIDKINFENIKLEKQLKLCKIEVQKKTHDLAVEKEKIRQLQEKLNKLQKQIKDYQVSEKKILKKSQTNEDLLKHTLKKKETDLTELHNFVWKEFNMVKKECFPKNFEIIQFKQPDFSKLWSEVKYSDVKSKEEALKKAVCIFQDNNKTLMEDNILLKSLLITTVEEIQGIIQLMCDKMHLPSTVLSKNKASDIFEDIGKLNLTLYKNILNEHFGVMKKICELFDEVSFTI